MQEKGSLTVTVNTKMTPEDVAMLWEEARKRGFTELGPFVRELILTSAALPTPTTLLLEVLLQFQYGMYEIAEKNAAGQPLPQVKIQSLRAAVETASGSLVTAYLNRRRQRSGE